MPLIGVIADDLTGATTTGALLARSKARTGVFFNEDIKEEGEKISKLDAIITSSNSRALPAQEAYEKVRLATCALKKMGIKYFTKRIDTTCRGGIGTEIDAMLDSMDEDTVAVVVPAMPQSKRILVGGYSVIDGVALIRTAVAQDVKTPVHENYIPRLLQGQTKREVGLITLGKVLEGPASIEKEFIKVREKGKQVIVVDAISIEDVEAIAQACINLEWNVLAVDPGAFTAKLAYFRGLIGEEKDDFSESTPIESDKTVLIAAGSATPVTKKQVEVLCQDPNVVRISVDALNFIEGGDRAKIEIDRWVSLALEHLKRPIRPRVILFETALHDKILDLDSEDEKRNYISGTSSNKINLGLATIISNILENIEIEKIAGLYTTGGDTMVSVCNQLGVECIELIDYVIPQTDICRLVGNYDGLLIVGKGGLTGTDNTAIDVVNRLFLESEREKVII